MADFNALQAIINAYIKRNGVQAITGQILNGVLTGMVNALGKGYTVAGAASPTTDPGTMTGPLAYIAYTAGTYTHFDNIVVEQGEVSMLIYNEAEWHKEVLFSLAAQATVDDNIGVPSVGVSFVDGILTFNFRNMKGEPGENGQDGDPAGFGTISASISGGVGTPGVSVQSSGPDTAKNIAFQFTNLKGETGVTSCVVTVDNTTGNPSCAVSLVGQELHLDFSGLKGAQGNTGSSVDYPFTIVNNLTTDDATQALSSAMGVQLESEVSQLEAEMTDIYSDLTAVVSFTPTWLDNNLLRDNGGLTPISSGGYLDACSTSDKIPCVSSAGKTLKLTHGATGTTALCFYKSTATLIGTRYTFSGSAGTELITIPSDAEYFRVGVDNPNHSDTLSGMKSALAASSISVISPILKPFVKGSYSIWDYFREIYVPDRTKRITQIIINKAVESGGTYRSRLEVIFSDSTSANVDYTWISTEEEAERLFEAVLTDQNNTFYILLSDKVPSGTEKIVNITEDFNDNAVHCIDYSPSIKEYINKAETDSDIAGLETTLNEDTTKIEGIISDLYGQFVFSKSWTDNKLLRDHGGITDIDSSQTGYYNRCSTTDKIPCVDYVGKTMNLAYGYASGDATYLAFYKVNDQLVGANYNSYSGVGTASVEIPSNAAYFRLGVYSASTAGLPDTKDAAIASVAVMKELASSGGAGKTYSAQRIGAMKYALPTDFDLPQLLFFGQSFAQGGSSKVVDTEAIPNCLMFGDNVKAITGNAFNPLQLRTDTTEPYEFPVVSCANALCNMYRRFGHDINIVASTAGASGASIHTLIESYLINVTNMHTNMYSVAQAAGKSVGCFAIVFMQGESDYGGREDSTPSKDAYKAYLLQVKNALQQSAMTNLHQTRKPLFFIYQTSGGWVRNYEGIDNEALGVSMAQLEFAAENDDVILISPAYQVTTYTDSHPSSNGYRWLGEYYAKAIWQTLYRGFRYKNPRPMDYKVEAKKITIYVSDCVFPLMKNTWTVQQVTTYGFSVKADDVSVAIKRVDLVDNAIVLNLATDISSASSVKLSYGGVGVGKGNICDSDTWGTWWQYLSDATDDGYDGNRTVAYTPTAEGGGSLVGKDYPMNNFLCIFFKEFTQ